MKYDSLARALLLRLDDPRLLREAADALAADPAGFLQALAAQERACKPTESVAVDPMEALKTRVPVWVNHGGNQPVFAKQLSNPRTLDDLRTIVREVGERGGRVKAVGSGHSFSDIVQTDDVLVNTKSLLSADAPGCVLPLESDLWKDPYPQVARARIACGGTIRQLNPALASAGLAFANLGGYDAQTFIGATSTSTHGSGITLPPLPDAVRSLVLVTTGGKVYQIEPCDGITDPAKFYRRYRRSELELVQNDDWFYSVLVSMGCMGVVYSMTVDLMGGYMLREVVTDEPWSRVRKRLEDPSYIARHRHLEVHVNPHANASGERRCNVVIRDIAEPGAAREQLPGLRRIITQLAFTPLLQRALLNVFNAQPESVPGLLDSAIAQEVTPSAGHVDAGFNVYNLGSVNRALVTAIEFSFPLADGVFLRAIDRLIDVIAQNRAYGIYQNGPLALRFVKSSSAYLSMMQGQASGTCEIAMFNGTVGGDEMLLSYEKAMYEFPVRLHWGQRQELTGAPGWLEASYPHAETWKQVYRTLNSRGVFDNHFTDRMGLSVCPERAGERKRRSPRASHRG